MSTITYDIARPRRPRTPATAPVRKRKGSVRPLHGSAPEAGHAGAARHGLRLPRELEEAGLKISARNEDSLPFVR